MSCPSTDRTRSLFRATTLFLLGMSTLPWLGPLVEHGRGRIDGLMGWINNYALFWCVTFAVTGLVALRFLDSGERRVAGAVLAGLGGAAAWTWTQTSDPLISLGGLGIVAGGIGAFGCAYTVQRAGHPLGHRLTLAVLLTTPALVLVPAFMIGQTTFEVPPHLSVPGYTNIRAFGHVCATVIAAATLLSVHRQTSRLGVWAAMATLAMGWCMLFWSGSRAGALAALLGLALLLAVLARHIAWTRLLGAGGATLAGMLASALLPVPGGSGSFDMLARLETTLDAMWYTPSIVEPPGTGGMTETLDTVSSGRLDLWSWTLGKIAEAPLTGWGYLPMSSMEARPHTLYHSHNIVLEYWLSYGLPAGSVALGALLLAWGAGVRGVRQHGTPALAATLACTTVLGLYGTLSATLFAAWPMLVFMTGLGCVAGCARAMEPDAVPATAPPATKPPETDALFPDAA